MAVVAVSTFTVKPDRYGDSLEDVRKIKAIVEKCGGKNVRLLAALVGGEATGSMAFISEADDFAGNGALTDKILADPEGQAVMASLNTSASSMVGGGTTLWMDVPL